MQIVITTVLIKKPIKTGTSFLGSSFVPSKRMKGIKKAPIPTTIVYSKIVIRYWIQAKMAQKTNTIQQNIVIIMVGTCAKEAVILPKPFFMKFTSLSLISSMSIAYAI